MQQAQRNSLDAVSFVQVAEGALDETGQLLIQRLELIAQIGRPVALFLHDSLRCVGDEALIAELAFGLGEVLLDALALLAESGPFGVDVDEICERHEDSKLANEGRRHAVGLAAL